MVWLVFLVIIFNHNRVWWDSLNEYQTGYAEFGTVPEVSLFVFPFIFLVVRLFYVDLCVKTQDCLFLSLVYKYNLKCRIGRGRREGSISIYVVSHRMSSFRVQMMTLQLCLSDNDSAVVLFWEWQCSCPFSENDSASASVLFWYWQWNCPVLIVTVQLSFSDNDSASASILFW